MVHLIPAALTLLLAAQPPNAAVTVTGCLQRAPSGMGKGERFVLMGASTSPMGGDAGPVTTPPEPARGTEPIERRLGESDARQETGGLTYLLEGGQDLQAKVGQQVEVRGTIDKRVTAPLTRPSPAQPVPQLKVTRVRALSPHCSAR